MIERTFGLQARGTTVRVEALRRRYDLPHHGLHPGRQSRDPPQADMDLGAVFVATCLAAASARPHGRLANYPSRSRPGWASTPISPSPSCSGRHSWQDGPRRGVPVRRAVPRCRALRVREWLINAHPALAEARHRGRHRPVPGLIGLQSAGIVVAHPVTLVTLGNLTAARYVARRAPALRYRPRSMRAGAGRDPDRHPRHRFAGSPSA